MSKSEQVHFLSAELIVAASDTLERIQCASDTLQVVEAGVASAAWVQALRLSGICEDAELEQLLLVFESAVETRLRAVQRVHAPAS